MPLTWSVKEVKNYHENFPDVTRNYDGREVNCWNPVVDVLVMIMMIIGMSEITEKNVDEFWTRLDLYQHHIHPPLREWKEEDEKPTPVYITRQQIEQLVGLHTNCEQLSAAQFDKKFMKILRREHKENA